MAIGVSGDGDTASIGMGQFKHLMRRNVRMVYIVENNGVYGLTKGQFSATADEGLELKYAGKNPFPPEELCTEAIAAGCTFVARSFSGDPRQVQELLKAALSHRGTAFLDIISPCVAFNNRDTSTKSYSWGKEHAEHILDIEYIPEDFVPVKEEIMVEEFEPGEVRLVELHDGSYIKLSRLDEDYDPTDRMSAMNRLEKARHDNELITGLLYINTERPSLAETYKLVDQPLASLPDDKLRPPKEALDEIMQAMG
jgi:2-oxoglutarate ferredoxin oxidoreductase subunit beta